MQAAGVATAGRSRRMRTRTGRRRPRALGYEQMIQRPPESSRPASRAIWHSSRPRFKLVPRRSGGTQARPTERPPALGGRMPNPTLAHTRPAAVRAPDQGSRSSRRPMMCRICAARLDARRYVRMQRISAAPPPSAGPSTARNERRLCNSGRPDCASSRSVFPPSRTWDRKRCTSAA